MACLGLVTFSPELDLSLPALNSCMTVPTFLAAAAFFFVAMGKFYMYMPPFTSMTAPVM